MSESHKTPGDLQGYLAKETDVQRLLARLYFKWESPVIFDIGACEGEDSIRYAHQFKKARLHTFEPLPQNQKLIRENFRRYDITQATLEPLALSNESGTVTFHVSSGVPEEKFSGEDWNYGNKSSSLLPPASDAPMHDWIEFKEQIEVTTCRLDEFCAERKIRHIDFMHIDVQGAEGMVIEGTGEMLKHIGAIWIEVANVELYAGQTLRQDIQRRLETAGFKVLFEDMRGDEGDQFYLNTRHWRNRMYLLAKHIKRRLGGS